MVTKSRVNEDAHLNGFKSSVGEEQRVFTLVSHPRNVPMTT